MADEATYRSAIEILERREAEALEQRDAALAALARLESAMPKCGEWVIGPRDRLGRPPACGKLATHVHVLSSGPIYLCHKHRGSWPKAEWADALTDVRKVLEVSRG